VPLRFFLIRNILIVMNIFLMALNSG
jgi:hypothetical protein